jgi:uncharacterized MAPEG superfamily protein
MEVKNVPFALTADIFWLVMAICFTGLMFTPYIFELMIEHNPFKVVWDSRSALPYNTDWAVRAKRAHYNAVENLVIFAPLVLVVQNIGLSGPQTALVAEIYFFARLVHFAAFTLAVPVVRTASFLVGFGCQAFLALRIFGWV